MEHLEITNEINKSGLQKICENSLRDLIEFHKIEREERFKTLQFFHGLFLGGGLALVTSAQKLDLDKHFSGVIQLITIIVILSVIAMAIRKLIAIRLASNRIYLEYTSRLRYVVEIELAKNSHIYQKDIEKYLNYYFKEPEHKKKLLRSGSADYFEIKILFFISVLLSLLLGLAIFNIINNPYWAACLALLFTVIYAYVLKKHIIMWGKDLEK